MGVAEVLAPHHFESLGDAWLNLLECVLESGAWIDDDGQSLIEVLNIAISVEAVTEDDLIREFADGARIDLMRRKYASLEPVPPYDRSYGSLFFDHCGVDQIAWAVDRLRQREYTKSATICFHVPGEERLSCLSMLDFKLRNDRLFTTAIFRSQNVFASHPGNLLALAELRDSVCRELDVEAGVLSLYVASGHIYEDDVEAARSVLRAAVARADWSPKEPSGSDGRGSSEVYPAHLVAARDTAQLAAEWDSICVPRDEAIRSGRDLSYELVLTPNLLEMCEASVQRGDDEVRILDAGCGSGVLTQKLAESIDRAVVDGIDPSGKSITLAQRTRSSERVSFERASIEEWAPRYSGTFDLVVGNMLLQNVADLHSVVGAARDALRAGGVFVFALPHPCYWPRYWSYDTASWFSYWDEQWIEAPFRTSLSGESGLVSTHVHRPLERYVACFLEAGFRVDELREPFPPVDIEVKYPRPWKIPRFLLGRLVRS